MTALDPSARVGTRDGDGGPGAPAFGLADPEARVPIRARQAVAVLLVVVLAAAGIGWCLVTGTPSSSATPDVFGGSLVLPFSGHDPIVVDLATSRATVRLQNLKGVVSAEDIDQVQLVPTDIGTFLVNAETGTYNMLDRNNVVVLRSGGIDLPAGADPAATVQPLATSGGMFLVRRSPARTEVYLITRDTILKGGAAKTVATRAAADLKEQSSAEPGAAVVVRDALWLVSQVDGDGAQLTRLSLATDPAEDDLVVERVAAINARARLAGGPDGTVAAAAAGVGRVVVAVAGSAPRELALSTTHEAKALVAAHGDGEGAWLATRADDGGWSLLQIRADGQAGEPLPIGDTRGIERLRPPLVSEGRAWAVSGDDGSIRRVDLARRETVRPAGADRYPVVAGEIPGPDFFAAAALTARGPRVVINVAGGLRALVIGDGGDEVEVVNKSTVLDFDPTATPSPEVEAGDGADPNQSGAPPPAADQETVRAKDPITDQHACQNLSQTPRKPVLRTLEPTKDSMVVSWLYTKLDPGDCQPSSYLIEARGVDGTDDPPNPVRVHATAELQYTFTGLRPNRTYQFRVTAVIGGNRTQSEPMQRKTDESGPDPARSVTTAGDRPGGWSVTWTACAGNECDTPAVGWEVSWALCGAGFIGDQRAIGDLPADQRQVDIALADHPDLIGRSLSFTVTSVSVRGQRASTNDGACTEGWRKPNGRQVLLQASGSTAPDGSVTIRATVENTPEKLAVFGGAAPQFVFESEGRSVGPTTAMAVDIPGLAAGETHIVNAFVIVHGERDKAPPVTVDPVFRDWPRMDAGLAITPQPGTNKATVTVTVTGAPTEALAQATLDCQGRTVNGPLPQRLTNGPITWEADLVYQLAPQCEGTVTMQQGDHPLYTGQPTLTLAPVQIAGLPRPAISAAWHTQPFGPFTRVFARFSGTVPSSGDQWKLVPSRPSVHCPSIALEGGRNLTNVEMDGTCFDEAGQFELQYQYLSGPKAEPYTVTGSRPDPPPPTTTTTTRPTTTTTRATTTTTRATTTTSGLAASGASPWSWPLVLAAGLVLATGARRVRLGGRPGSSDARPPARHPSALPRPPSRSRPRSRFWRGR